MFYRIFRMLAAATLRLFLRTLKSWGCSSAPGRCCWWPTMQLVGDPLLPLITLKRRITLTAKNVLKRIRCSHCSRGAWAPSHFIARRTLGRGPIRG